MLHYTFSGDTAPEMFGHDSQVKFLVVFWLEYPNTEFCSGKNCL